MNSSAHPWIGRCLGDGQRYRIDRRLGGGGMGDVFLATDTRIGLQVALKLLKDNLVESNEMRQRFEREITISAALPNEHIVNVSDCGVTPEGYPFYIMEYLRGESLGELLRREHRIGLDRATNIISQICSGLQPAHQGVTLPSGEHIKEVVHRDLKPDNIFLVSGDSGDRVKIVDFGIAKLRNERSEQLTLTSTFLGTLRYSSPEQMMGDKNLDGRADIYSLGVMLYEMVTGADPFGFSLEPRHVSEASWIVAHTQSPPKPMRSQPDSDRLSPELDNLVLRCLAKDPQDRVASVVELNRALQAIMTDTGEDRTRVQPRLDLAEEIADTIRKPLQIPPVEPAETPTVKRNDRTNVQTRPTSGDLSAENQADALSNVQPRPNSGDFNGISGSALPPVPNEPLRPGVIPPVERQVAPVEPIPPSPPPVKPEATIVQPRSPQSAPSHQPLPPSIDTKQKWVKIGAGAVVGLGLIVAGGIYFQIQSQSQTVLEQVTSLKQQQKYTECINQAQQVSSIASGYDRVQVVLNECRLAYAIDLKAKDRLVEAIDIVKKIPPSSEIYEKAQKYLAEWTTL